LGWKLGSIQVELHEKGKKRQRGKKRKKDKKRSNKDFTSSVEPDDKLKFSATSIAW